jgi:hypothetical protein
MTEIEKQDDSARSQLIDDALRLYIGKSQRENTEDKSWIRQPNNFISAVAIVISLLSVAYGFIKDYYDGIDKNLQSLSAAVSDLTKIDTDTLAAATTNTDPAALSNIELVLNNRRIALLAEADRLIAQLGKRAPRTQLAVLGPAYVQVNDYATATKYFLLLTDPSEAPTLRLEAWRSLAATYIIEGRDYYDKARDAFRNAAGVFPKPTDVGSLMLAMNVYEQWAQFELVTSNFQSALQQFENARQLGAQLPCPTLRPSNLTRINGELQQTIMQFQSRDPDGAKQAMPSLAAASDNAC